MDKNFERELIDKQERAIAPSIFIGLGGVGCKIVTRLANVAKKEGADNKNVCFVAMDTDVNDLRKIKANNKNIITIQTSARKTIGEYLEADENARENWFPLNDILLKKTPTEGAGQVRAISNLVAHNATRQGDLGELDRAIDSLFPLSTDEMQQSARITIVGSVAGGTGSGLILPIALYVKNYLEKVRQQKSSVVRGFFFLPDAMDSVVTKEIERDNLRSNAYASIREIDAFMRWKYDHKLRERYPELRVIMPKVGGKGYTEFNDSPFNFCFLFNKIDSKSTSIFDHFELLDHAAECIFDMTISPISSRVNSQEDNIIREITKSKNSSSYAGTGSSKLVYPYEDIVNYIALNWAKQTISKQWLDADNEVQKKKIENEKRRSTGAFVPDEDENEIYANHVTSMANSENNFYMGIRNQCLEQKDQAGKREELSTKFVSDLEDYTENIRVLNLQNSDAYHGIKNALKKAAAAVEETPIKHAEQASTRVDRAKKATNAVRDYMRYKDDLIENARTQIIHITSTIVGAEYDPADEKSTPVLEKYMYKTSQLFMHPNAARYFLIEVSKELERQIDELKLKLEPTKKAYEKKTNELEGLLLKDDNEHVEASKGIAALGEAAKEKLTEEKTENFNPSERSLDIHERLEHLLSKNPNSLRENENGKRTGILDDYCYYIVSISVFEKINNYVKSLISGYVEFFKDIRGDIEDLGKNITELENKYTNVEGTATVYVCSSAKCLKKLSSQCKNSIGAFDLPIGLTTSIHEKAKKYAIMNMDGSFNDEYGLDSDSSESERNDALKVFFGDVFETVIMEFWRSTVEKNCSSKLDVDVIRALYNEGMFEAGCHDQKSKREYMVSRVIGAENLSTPFIDAPGGEPRTISVVAINNTVSDSLNGEEIQALNKAMQGEFNRIQSPEISKYQLRIYQSIYNIKAKNLTKFACADDTSHGGFEERFSSCGTYSRVYHERISQIEPLDADNTEITPHIEKTWQYINVLPELDDDFQHREEVRIAKAFVYALISGKIAYRQHDLNGYNYCYEIIDPTVKAPELYVSNGTRCDQFYELLDAFTLCPRYVDRLLELLDRDIQFEKNLGRDFMKTKFASVQSNSVIIDEFSISQKLNIFYIPLLYKASAASNYIKDWGESMIEAIFELIDEYIAKLEDPKSVSDIKCEFLSNVIFKDYHDQMDVLIALKDGDPNAKLKREHSRLERLKNDTLTLRVYDLIAEELRASDAMNPHVGQYSKTIEEIETARRKLSSDSLINADK